MCSIVLSAVMLIVLFPFLSRSSLSMEPGAPSGHMRLPRRCSIISNAHCSSGSSLGVLLSWLGQERSSVSDDRRLSFDTEGRSLCHGQEMLPNTLEGTRMCACDSDS